jgi:hypothetical protein
MADRWFDGPLSPTQTPTPCERPEDQWPPPLHAKAPVMHVVGRVGRGRGLSLTPLGAGSKRQHDEERGEPSVPVHRCPLGHLIRTSDRLDQARVIVLDVADPRADWPAVRLRKGRALQAQPRLMPTKRFHGRRPLLGGRSDPDGLNCGNPSQDRPASLSRLRSTTDYEPP